MKLKITISVLLLVCVIYGQDKPTTSPFKGCNVEDECFNERFKEWFSGEVGDILKYKDQKAVIELLVNEKGETEAIITVLGDTEELTDSLSKALAKFPNMEPALDKNKKPYALICSITVKL